MAETIQNHENRAKVEAFYKALAKGHAEDVAKHLSSDLEWWFHGPPHCQHMRRVLTGESDEFRFKPRSVTAIEGDRVIAEGWQGAQAYWIHVWTLKGGFMTQLREYFNTCLTVSDLRPQDNSNNSSNNSWEIEPMNGRRTLWQSRDNRSMPGLVLAI